MDIKPAKKDSWKTHEMPQKVVELRLERSFSPVDFERIKLGLIPAAMEDKWFIYYDNGWLYFHRSWTGICIYQIRLKPFEDTYKVTQAWINRDPVQYVCTDAEHDIEILNFLIDRLLLGRDVPFPMQSESEKKKVWWPKISFLVIGKEKRRAIKRFAYQHHIIGWGRSNEDIHKEKEK